MIQNVVSREIYFTRDRAPVVAIIDMESAAPKNYLQRVRLNAAPPDDYTWIFQWPGGKVAFFWKNVPSANNHIQIQPTIAECIEAAVDKFNANYYFSKDFVASVFVIGVNIYFQIKAKILGAQYCGLPISTGAVIESSPITIIHYNLSPLEQNQKLNHQVGILLYSAQPGLNTEGADTNILVSEHIAPVLPASEVINVLDLVYDIQNPLHSLTSFKPANICQDTIIRADGHSARVTPAAYEIYGQLPVASDIEYFDDVIALRGGSRFENHNHGMDPIGDDFVEDYIKTVKKGVLNYSNFAEVTLRQEQYRYWFNYHDTIAIKVNLTIVFKPEEESVGVISGPIYSFQANKYDVLIIPVGIGWLSYAQTLIESASRDINDIDYYYLTVYEFYTSEFLANLGYFRITQSVFGEKYFLFENSAGGGEILRFTGEKSYSVEISKKEYEKMHLPWDPINYQYWQQQTKAQQLVGYSELYECSTGNLTRQQVQHYIDILISENVYEIIYFDDQGNNLEGYRYAIIIEPGSFRITNDRRDGEYIYNLSFKYRRAYNERSTGLVNNHE